MGSVALKRLVVAVLSVALWFMVACTAVVAVQTVRMLLTTSIDPFEALGRIAGVAVGGLLFVGGLWWLRDWLKARWKKPAQ
jgi:hypothetical protein